MRKTEKEYSIDQDLKKIVYEKMRDIWEHLGRIRDARQMRDFKSWLIYEYGLDVLLPFIQADQIDLEKGKDWEELRGSLKALTMALEWLGFPDVKVECMGPGKAFFRYQIDLGRAPEPEEVEKIKGIAELSSAHRDQLFRIYIKKYDLRNMALGQAPLGLAMLSDFSGTTRQGIRQAFSGEDLCQK